MSVCIFDSIDYTVGLLKATRIANMRWAGENYALRFFACHNDISERARKEKKRRGRLRSAWACGPKVGARLFEVKRLASWLRITCEALNCQKNIFLHFPVGYSMQL